MTRRAGKIWLKNLLLLNQIVPQEGERASVEGCIVEGKGEVQVPAQVHKTHMQTNVTLLKVLAVCARVGCCIHRTLMACPYQMMFPKEDEEEDEENAYRVVIIVITRQIRKPQKDDSCLFVFTAADADIVWMIRGERKGRGEWIGKRWVNDAEVVTNLSNRTIERRL